MVKSLEYFQSNNCLLSEFFYCFCQILFNLGPVRFSASWKKLSSCFFLRVILITYSITLCLEKKLLFWKKVWKKSVRTLYDTFSHDTIRHCNLAFIRLRIFEAKLFPSFLLLSSISNLWLFEEVLYWIWISRRHLFANDCTGVHSRLSADIQYYCRLETPFSHGVIFCTGSPVSLAQEKWGISRSLACILLCL